MIQEVHTINDPSKIMSYTQLKDASSGNACCCLSSGGGVEKVRALLDMGVDVNFVPKSSRDLDERGHHEKQNYYSALQVASGNDNFSFLLPMWCRNDNLDIIQLLLIRGADVNFANSMGETSLSMAVHIHNNNAVKLLLESGADPYRSSTKPCYSCCCLPIGVFPIEEAFYMWNCSAIYQLMIRDDFRYERLKYHVCYSSMSWLCFLASSIPLDVAAAAASGAFASISSFLLSCFIINNIGFVALGICYNFRFLSSQLPCICFNKFCNPGYAYKRTAVIVSTNSTT